MSSAQSTDGTKTATPSLSPAANNAPREVDVRVREAQQYGRPVRAIRQGGFYTQDYVPDRVNIEYDTNGKVTGRWMG